VPADKSIPVTEETREQLHDLKKSGQTYDDLLQELAQQRRRAELAERFDGLEAAESDELTAFEGV
jgi:predicted CopG family antitoxin